MLQVIIRSFGTYQAQLWDDIFAEFAPITENDVILVNFGAWYPRFKISEPHLPWQEWQNAMTELFTQKLATTPAQVLLRALLSLTCAIPTYPVPNLGPVE